VKGPSRETRHRRPRLSKSADFDRVYRKGRSVSSRHLVLYAFPRSEDDSAAGGDARLGVPVGRKVGGAVERNRVKRRVREAFWSLAGELPARHDFVVVARPSASELVEAEGVGGLERDLRDLAGRLDGSSEDSREPARDSPPDSPSAEAA
jgi:ribonuclease P protein component